MDLGTGPLQRQATKLIRLATKLLLLGIKLGLVGTNLELLGIKLVLRAMITHGRTRRPRVLILDPARTRLMQPRLLEKVK